MTENREYKSDVFSMLLEDKANALQIYNAMNGSDYKDAELIEICTLERGISLSIRNDASFLLDMNLSIYEHQSTVCPNMPVRGLLYISSILAPMLKKKNIYGRKQIPLPTPRFAVFYNGTEELPDQYELKLSDAYVHQTEQPELELICKVYNINSGRNRGLLEKCPILLEYATFIEYVRSYHKESNYERLGTAIETAIDRCIAEGILADFLMERRTEVLKVMQLDYTFDRQIELEREDALEEGRKLGVEQGREEGILQGREQGIQQGREEGIQQGREQGIQQGREQGIQQGRIQMLADFLKNGGSVDDAKTFLLATDEEIAATRTL